MLIPFAHGRTKGTAWLTSNEHDRAGATLLATVSKRASDAVGRRALATEAGVLGRLAHPGVVRLVAHSESDSHAELLTELVTGPTCAEFVVDRTDSVAAVAAAAAAVVADLHALGIAHGSLAPEHLIWSDGRVVLCSFGRAGEATADAMDRDVADLVTAIAAMAARLDEPATRVERRRRRNLDAMLVGAASRSLSAAQLGSSFAELAVVPGAAAHRRPTETDLEPPGRRHAPTGADLPGAPADTEGPAATAPARLWRERVARPGPDRGSTHEDQPWYRRRGVLVGGVAGIIAVALWIGLAPRSRDPTPLATPPVATASSTSPPTSAPTAVAVPSPVPATVAVIGNLVALDGIWFEVGRTDDIVRVGDWDCNGTPSPALLRPASGEVFVFDGWVDDGVRRVGPLTVVPDAVDLQAMPAGPCHTLVAIDDQGRESALEVAS